MVIPVRGHSSLLEGCLDALREQLSPVHEVIVVDDSPDGSLVAPPDVRVVLSGGRGPYAARNIGWRSTDADVVLFCDARSRPRPTWSQRLVGLFEDPAVVIGGSDVLVESGDSVAARAAAELQTFSITRYVDKPFLRPYFATCNLAVRRSALEVVGGFPEVRSGGDAELCWLVLDQTGGELAAVREVLMDWRPRNSARSFLEQHFRYGRSNHELRVRWQDRGARVVRPRHPVKVLARSSRAVLRLAASQRASAEARTQHLVAASHAAGELGYAVAHWASRAELRRRARHEVVGSGGPLDHRLTVLTNIAVDRTNPWLSLWRDACEGVGLRLVGLDRKLLLTRHEDLPAGVHLQWPEHCLNAPSAASAAGRAARLLSQVALARVRGLPVLLTTHNVTSHHAARPVLERIFWSVLSRVVTDVHSFTAAGRADVVAHHPALGRCRWHTIPHGTYAPVVGEVPTREAARADLGLPSAAVVALTFGAMKRYKGVGELIDLVRASPVEPGTVLALVGAPDGPALRSELEAMARTRDDVVVHLEYVSTSELVTWIAASDVVVLPYRRVLNSGSTMLALTCHRPVLLPESPTFAEMAGDVGEGWITTYRGPLTSEEVWRAARAERGSAQPDLSKHDWQSVRAGIALLRDEVFATPRSTDRAL